MTYDHFAHVAKMVLVSRFPDKINAAHLHEMGIGRSRSARGERPWRDMMTTMAQSTDKCPDCKRPIYRSALQLNKLYCWFCRKYRDKAA